MKVSQLFFYIALAIIGFWLLGVLLKLAQWILDIGLVIALVIVLIAIVNEFFKGRKPATNDAGPKKVTAKRVGANKKK